MMRTILGASAALVFMGFGLQPAAADNYAAPWCAVVAMGACQKPEQQTTQTPAADASKMTADTSHMMMADTSHKMAPDTPFTL